MQKILVVDDEPDIVRTLAIFFEIAGYTVLTAATGEEALRRIRAEKPDAVILDVVLPDRNGNEMATALKQDPLTSAIPLLLITAQSQKNDLLALEGSAADGIVTKPFDIDALKDRIEELLGTAHGRGKGGNHD